MLNCIERQNNSLKVVTIGIIKIDQRTEANKCDNVN